jgi:hypothetical protein
LPPLECCFGTSPIQAEKSRPDRKAFGSATLATSAVASAGPTPGSSSSRWLTWLDRCQAMIRRSNSSIRALSICSWAPSAAIQARVRPARECGNAALDLVGVARVDRGILPTDEELKQARARREKGNPPGKLDDPLGDQVTWEQLLTYCKTKNVRQLWIISSDTDYVETFERSCFINPFLHRDLVNACGNELDIRCFNKLGDGIKDFGKNAGVKAEKLPTDAELEDINKEMEAFPPRAYIVSPVPGSYFLNTNDPWIENADLQRRRRAAVMSGETSAGPLTLRGLEQS